LRLEGKVALLTGAATRIEGELMGFAGASAWRFVREGARAVLTDVDEEAGETAAAQIRAQGGDAAFVRLDVTRESEWAEAVRAVVSRYNRLDILVNSAGTTARHDVEHTSVDAWDGQMAVHATGSFLGIKHCAPEMRRSGAGSVINISSIAGMVGSTTSTAYHAAKGAVRLLTKAAAVRYAGDGIRVNSVHPGYADTPLTREIFSDPKLLAERLASVPMGRLATADEVAGCILFLASDESSYVTGAELVIDGGVTAQ
jgi:NAD(P)-dependent dehydrogenase (short-subunit alcohol dehydrogenase family)